jgi:hypothetical protein
MSDRIDTYNRLCLPAFRIDTRRKSLRYISAAHMGRVSTVHPDAPAPMKWLADGKAYLFDRRELRILHRWLTANGYTARSVGLWIEGH